MEHQILDIFSVYFCLALINPKATIIKKKLMKSDIVSRTILGLYAVE